MSCNLCMLHYRMLYYRRANWIVRFPAQVSSRPRDIESRYEAFLFDPWLLSLVTMSESRIGVFSQLFAPKPLWTSKDVPDQTDKTVLITGGNRGIGREMARVRQ